MTGNSRLRRAAWRATMLGGTMLALFGAPGTAMAQGGGGDSATVKLIQLLIQKGILTKGQAASLLSQAQEEAGGTPAPAARHGRRAPRAAPMEAAAEPPPVRPGAPAGEVRVTYVPQFVRDQIASEVRGQVMQQVKDEGWAQPHTVPSWIDRVTLYGDVRLRYQGDYEDKHNVDPASGLPYGFLNFNAINNGSPFDQSGASGLPPTLNVSENRDRYRIRARIGVRAQIADWIGADVRIATGNDNSPVSENQTLGAPGDFSKYAIYIDRAYLTFTINPDLRIYAGREPNPYFVSDLMFAPDLNFDGVSVQYDRKLTQDASVFVNGGVYPVFNTDLNFSSTNLEKGSSHDAYLLAAQLGGRWAITPDYALKVAAGYFAYSNITGKESAPCLLFTSADTCSTDDTRPAFVQFGNTMFPLRDIVTTASTLQTQPEYYGLASHFGILDAHARVDAHSFDPVVVSLEGEYVKNLAYNRAYILARSPVNNFGSLPQSDKNPNDVGPYQGGNTGYMAKLTVGYPEISKLWDWNVSLAYKYLESDAVVDAFTDPDFHLGGTNAKGYVLGGNLGIAHNTSFSVRWLSTNQIGGPYYGNDVLQVDLNAKF